MSSNFSLTDWSLNSNSMSVLNVLDNINLFNNSVDDIMNNRTNFDIDLKAIYFSTLINVTLNNINNISAEYENYSPIPYPDFTQISFVRILILIFYSLAMFLALFGNSVVCYTVISNRKMQTVVNCYIVNLAFCDFLVGAFVLPVKLLELMAPANWCAFSDGLCTVMLYLQTVIVFSSVLTLVAICLERYFAIIHPLKSRINKSKSRTFKIIFMTYLIPSLVSLPFLYPKAEAIENTLQSSYGTISRLTCFINFDPQFRKIYYTFLFISFYLIPLAFIVWTCFCIARSLLRITGLNRQGSLRRQEINRRKIGQMILIVVMAYTISWTPYFIVSIITQYQEVNFMQKHDYYFTMLCINLFAFLNSSINPFIYAIMSTRFRNGFMRVLRVFFCITDTKDQDIVNTIPRRMPKTLSCLNKYHRQMLLFACGDPSQLSTDSSTQHNESSVDNNIFISSIRLNKISLRRGVTPSLTMKEITNSYQNNNYKKRNSKEVPLPNKCGLKAFCLHSNPVKYELFDTKPISITTKMTGSESKLPRLKKFWEDNFIDSTESSEQNKRNSTLYRSICAVSLPNLPIILSKDMKNMSQ